MTRYEGADAQAYIARRNHPTADPVSEPVIDTVAARVLVTAAWQAGWDLDEFEAVLGKALAEARAEGAREALLSFADSDLHNLIPFSEIGNSWFHTGVEWTQNEARDRATENGAST